MQRGYDNNDIILYLIQRLEENLESSESNSERKHKWINNRIDQSFKEIDQLNERIEELEDKIEAEKSDSSNGNAGVSSRTEKSPVENKDGVTGFKCKHCGSEWDSKRSRGQHERQCDQKPENQEDQQETEKVECQYCGEKFKPQGLPPHEKRFCDQRPEAQEETDQENKSDLKLEKNIMDYDVKIRKNHIKKLLGEVAEENGKFEGLTVKEIAASIWDQDIDWNKNSSAYSSIVSILNKNPEFEAFDKKGQRKIYRLNPRIKE